jgi:hypothetical protein
MLRADLLPSAFDPGCAVGPLQQPLLLCASRLLFQLLGLVRWRRLRRKCQRGNDVRLWWGRPYHDADADTAHGSHGGPGTSATKNPAAAEGSPR